VTVRSWCWFWAGVLVSSLLHTGPYQFIENARAWGRLVGWEW
jgi:hypothetical protein